MKKSFSYNLTQFGSAGTTVTEQIKTSDGVKTITTDANTGAVILADSVDEDSLNPVTAAAVADAVASASGGVPVIGDGDNGKVLKAVVDGSSKSVAWGSDSDNAYIATYGTTTYQELSAAHTAGKAIFVTNVSGSLSSILPMSSFSTNPAMVIFTTVIGSVEYTAKIDQDVWSSTSVSLQADWNESNQLAPSYVANKPTVDQVYDASSTNAQSGTAVAGAIAGVRQVPSTQSSDNGKVLGVTNSSGTLGWVAKGGSVVVDSSSPLSGSGTQASPLGLSVDTNSLEVASGGFELTQYRETFASDSDAALYLDSASPVTITVSGLTSSSSARNVNVAISWDPAGEGFITWSTKMVIAANTTTASYTLDVHNVDTQESVGSWSTAAGRNYFFNFTSTDGMWTPQTYTRVTAGIVGNTLSVKNPVPSASSADNGKVLGVTDTSGTLGWVSAGGGSSGYTPVDLNPITEGPYTIPVGNREDVYVQVSGYTASTTLTLELANDCTDAIVTVNATSAINLDDIQVSRGNTSIQIYGLNTVNGVTSQYYANDGRVLLTTVDGGSSYEPPTDFSEIEVGEEGSLIGSVEATYAVNSLRGLFSIEIKGRCAILHTP